MAGLDPDDLDRVFRREHGQVVATLMVAFGDLDIAEEATAEAFAIAARTWRERGLPPNPGGWITTTARRRAIDRLRREAERHDRQAQAAWLGVPEPAEPTGPLHDDLLRLVFTCCHPALSPEARVALTLRLVAGLTTAEIARAFLVSDAAMEQRLVRAKHKVRAAKLPYRVPEDHELPRRLPGVLAVVYLIYNEGYLATSGEVRDRVELATEGIRLARLLDTLMPDEPEVRGLLALLLFTDARRAARTTATGELRLLADQDRSRWDRELLAEAHELLRSCLRRDRPGPYQLQAAIGAVHAEAPTVEDTDWHRVLALYDQLLALAPTPVVALNRAVALAEVDGPAQALSVLDALGDTLDRYHLYHATRAEMLARLGETAAASATYATAHDLTRNLAERRLLERKRRALEDRSG